MKFDLNSLLKDKNVLYVTLFIAITNMFAYLTFRQFNAIIFFVIVGIITSYFSKNMIIIMLVAILSTNFAIGIKLVGKVREGMENKKEKKEKGKEKGKGKEGYSNEDGNKKRGNGSKDAPACVGESCLKGGNKKEKFTQQLNPARIHNDEDDSEVFESEAKVDYASTLESAYDNLDKLLSSEAINNMTEDTHRLAEKQQMLMGNINKLQPMMEKAGSLLEGLNMDKMNDVFNGLTDKIGGGKKDQKKDEKKE